MFTFLALVFAAVLLLYVKLRWHYAYWRRRGVAGETPVYFRGNMSGLGKELHWTDINWRIYKKFSGTERYCGYFTFLNKALFVMDLELVRKIMISDFGSFADRGLFHNVRDDPLTGNLLFLDGPEWRWLRQNLTQVFTSGKMKLMFPNMVEVGERLAQACHQQIGEIEAKDLCARFTTDVIGSCAFGLECNSLQDPDSEFRRMGRSVTTEPLHSVLVQAFMFSQPALARMLRMRLFRPEVSAFFLDTVRQTLDYRRRENIHRNDLIQLLMELGEEGAKDALSFEQIAAQALVFFLAGFDTSSTTMSFCLYELALNPDIQDQLRVEILDVLSRNNQKLTYESVQEMPYLDQVVSETLRKYPILPHLLRLSTKEYLVPDSNLTLEPGTKIMIPVHSIHHDPELYPDPEKFDPSRFEPEEIRARHPFAYLPFGEGPRNCIGERFGKLQVKVGLVYLLRDFMFSRSKQTQIPLKFSSRTFLISTQEGVNLHMERVAAP
ncbi:probable cytochrome P450 6a13 [Drosophila gunungcola]|uniref:probable cytochrome P450 6a13 n=1 Tax=Drosophila gunungcola TaxID=103775 RepID=UPI0022E274EC|nr:probable cytochrome P450 6a13 [Drosophila gunungcola]